MPAKSGIARFKVVIAATREGVHLHPSVEDIPENQQRLAREALDGEMAATLLIADKAGLKRMQGLLEQVEGRKKAAVTSADVARQLGLGFLACGVLLLAFLAVAWFR